MSTICRYVSLDPKDFFSANGLNVEDAINLKRTLCTSHWLSPLAGELKINFDRGVSRCCV